MPKPQVGDSPGLADFVPADEPLEPEVLDDDAATELLEPYRGHRFRVQQLLALMGARRPRHAPRMTLPTHTPYATGGRS